MKVNFLVATFNFILSFGLIGALVTGYVIGLRIFDLGITSIGLYGTILISEYLVQLTCAIVNRHDVNRIANNLAKRRATARAAGDREKGEANSSLSGPLNPDGEASIVVVGYREDEQAWRACVRSLGTQTLKPKCIIGVVDGNEEPDLSMARAFVSEFETSKRQQVPLIDLPILLSDMHRDTYSSNIPADTRWFLVRFWHYLVGRGRPGHAAALVLARQAVIDQVLEWNEKWNISSLDAVCFSQPHGHKRTAMFTAFAMSLYAVRTRHAVFTTDSDTLLQANGLDEMLTLLRSSPGIGGVTADVKIWNRAESLLARMCSARYWFAFNIERACQSLWRCVGCLSGPMSMYRACDLDTILGPWNLQSFGGKATTFGDDRHLTNQLLAHGLKARYTHRTWCDSESPTSFVRWIAQQTRWSKSFFRETFWFPRAFALHSPWLLLESTIQTLYPFILIATAFHFLFDGAANHWRPVIWLVTMFGVAFFKSCLAVIISWDPWLLLFSFYGFVYFFGLLPSKVWALCTMNQTGWGTSARSSSERKRGQSFLQRSFQVGHLVVWYTAVFVGLGFFIYRIFDNPLFFLIGIVAIGLAIFLYWDRSAPISKIISRPFIKVNGMLKRKARGLPGREKEPAETSAPFHQVDEAALPEKPPSVYKPSEKTATVLTEEKSEKSKSSVEITPVDSPRELQVPPKAITPR
ncbi:hypothetical protein ANO11243_060650 [Dothideomycetidae sp. 11243]|nr:hypothetical protein ANO11243_060650 [fungal sp. No.11243]